MRLYESQQSNTSPLKYHLELTPDEFAKVKELIMDIIKSLQEEEQAEKNELTQIERWIELNAEIVEWMTEPTKFPPRSDCG
jgi:hypothetical protein